MYDRKKMPNTLILSGFAYHRELDSPVIILNDLDEGRPFPLLLTEMEALWILQEIQGEEGAPVIYQDFLKLIELDKYSLSGIFIRSSVTGPVCELQLKRGLRSKFIQVEPGDGVLLSIRTGKDLILDPEWSDQASAFDWLGGISRFTPFGELIYQKDFSVKYFLGL